MYMHTYPCLIVAFFKKRGGEGKIKKTDLNNFNWSAFSISYKQQKRLPNKLH